MTSTGTAGAGGTREARRAAGGAAPHPCWSPGSRPPPAGSAAWRPPPAPAAPSSAAALRSGSCFSLSCPGSSSSSPVKETKEGTTTLTRRGPTLRSLGEQPRSGAVRVAVHSAPSGSQSAFMPSRSAHLSAFLKGRASQTLSWRSSRCTQQPSTWQPAWPPGAENAGPSQEVALVLHGPEGLSFPVLHVCHGIGKISCSS